MRAAVLSLLFVLSTRCIVAQEPAGSLFGVFRRLGSDPLVCDLARVFFNGTNETYSTTACDGILQSYPAFTTLNNGALILAISTATDIFSIDTTTHATAKLAPLPQPYNASDPFIGLVSNAGFVYLVTQYNLYEVSSGKLVVAASYPNGFSDSEPQVAVAPTGGSSGSGRIFVSDGASRSISVIDLGKPTNVTVLHSSLVSAPWDLQYSKLGDELLELVNYQLYTTNSRTGRSRSLCPIPDGPGYPRVNGISPDGATFFFWDFSNEYTIDVASGKILSKAPIFSAPLVVGYPVWLSN